jgi:hypothetical protein
MIDGNNPKPTIAETISAAVLALSLIILRARDRQAKGNSMSGNHAGGTAPGPTLSEIIGSAAFALGLITAWLYAAGWTYAYHYFDRFRIPLLLADLPREHLLIYGGLTVQKNPLAAVSIAILVITAVAILLAFRRRLGRAGITGVLVLGVLALFLLARLAGTATAATDFALQRESDYRAYPRVEFDIKSVTDPARDSNDKALALVGSGCARLVLASKERLFLIRPVKGRPDLELHTFVLPWSDVKTMRITGQYTSCE